jgi:hypothetical protein
MACIFLPITNLAQSTWFGLREKWEVSPKFGTGLIVSDLSFYRKDRKDITWAQNFSIGKKLNPWLGARMELINTELSGSGPFWDTGEEDPIDVRFYAKNIEYYFSLQFDLSTIINGSNPQRKFLALLTTGVGMANWRTDMYDTYTLAHLTGNGHKPYGSGIDGRTLEGIVPVGLILEYKVFKFVSIEWENTLHFVNSDKLDNVWAGFSKDAWWFSGLGIKFDLGFDRRKNIPLAPYSANPDLLPLKYKDLEFSMPGKSRIKTGGNPKVSYQLPRKIGSVEEFPLQINIMNDGVSGLVDIEILLPDGFFVDASLIKGIQSEYTDKLLNLYTSLPASDTSLQFIIPVKVSDVPVGNYAFYLTSKFTDVSGEAIRRTSTEYVEKDLFFGLNEAVSGSASSQGVEFRVQLTSSHERKIPMEKVKLLYPVKTVIKEDFDNGFFQYTTGSFKTKGDADKYRQELIHDYGLSDIYVVFFQNGSRISSFSNLSNSSELYLRENNSLSRKKNIDQTPTQRIDEYRIEIRSSQFRPVPLNEMTTKFRTPERLSEEYTDGWYHYYAGSFNRKDIANVYLKIIRDDYGFNEARIVSFIKGIRIKE